MLFWLSEFRRLFIKVLEELSAERVLVGSGALSPEARKALRDLSEFLQDFNRTS